MGIEGVDNLKEGDDNQHPEESLGTIADGDEVPESEEEITQSEDPINPEEAAEEEE